MANPLRGEVSFTHDANEYVLKYDVNRLCELEALTGRRSSDLVKEVDAGNMIVLRAFVWAGLRNYDLSLSQAGELATAVTPPTIGPLIMRAMATAFPKPDEPGEGDADPQTAAAATHGTGNSSSDAG